MSELNEHGLRRLDVFVAALFGGWTVLAVGLAKAEDGASVHVTLRTGEVVAGRLLSHTDEVVVLEYDGVPHAVAHRQMTGDSAYRTRRALLIAERGSLDALTAADFHALGVLALEHDRVGFARRDFAAAVKHDELFRSHNALALKEFGRRRDLANLVPFGIDDAETGAGDSADPIVAGYKEVGRRFAESLGGGVVLLETKHFLIWTDWIEVEHDLLRRWCESAYSALRSEFRIAEGAAVFAGKCPVFCLKSRKRFKAAARLLDDYDAAAALGYTSADANGHVHMVLSRQGGSYAGRLAFANTLVHEGTHLFIHRIGGGHRLPGWLSEGLADRMAENVLGVHSPNGETAAATAREIVRGDYNVRGIFADDHSPAAVYYPVANSLVAFLEGRDAEALRALIVDIKTGEDTEAALGRHYGWTFDTLERAWRDAHRTTLTAEGRTGDRTR